MTNVLHLLQLEWLKLRHYRPFLAIMILYAILLPAFMYTGKKIDLPKEFGSSQTFFMFPNIWAYLGYIGNWLVFFLMGFLAVQSISNETFNRTLRQNVISGLSRTDFFLSKFYSLVIISFVATVYYAFCALVFGYTHTDTVYSSKVLENIDLVPRYFLMCMGYASLGFFLGVVFSRSILGLFVYFAYIMFIEKIIRYVLIRKLLGTKAMLFAPMNATSDLVPPPVPRILNQTIQENIRLFLYPNEAIITTLIFSTLFFLGAYYLLKTRDL